MKLGLGSASSLAAGPVRVTPSFEMSKNQPARKTTGMVGAIEDAEMMRRPLRWLSQIFSNFPTAISDFLDRRADSPLQRILHAPIRLSL
jgi:hypothetical protein